MSEGIFSQQELSWYDFRILQLDKTRFIRGIISDKENILWSGSHACCRRSSFNAEDNHVFSLSVVIRMW